MKRMSILGRLCAALLFGSGAVAVAQPPSIGVKGGYQYIWNTSSISIIPGSDDCGNFTNGTASGFFAGLTGEYALFGGLIEASGALVFSSRPAQLTTMSNDNFEVLDPGTNSYVPLRRQHAFQSTLGYVNVEVGLRVKPLAWLPVYLRIAADAGNPLVGSNYTQSEEIVEPSTVLFPGGLKRRPTGSGEFPGLGTSYGAIGSIGAEIPWMENVTICPEVGYRRGLNSVTSTDTWNQSMLMAGVQVRYTFNEPAPVPAVRRPEEPSTPPSPPPTASVKEPAPVMIASISTTPLELRETVVTQTFPLLPYLFFDSTSATLRERYTSNEPTDGFNEQALPKQTLPIYYRMLDVIGRRMVDNPRATLTVTGTTDGRELPAVDERKKLAERRAQNVISYLTSRWGLATSRFVLRTLDRPALVSSDRYAEGWEENRRVELASSEPTVMGPVVHTRFNEYIPVQPRHEFTTSVRNPELARSWNLDVGRARTSVATRGGDGLAPERIVFDLDQDMTDKLGPVVNPVDTLDARLAVTQQDGSTVDASTRFPLIKTVSNYEVSRLSLIVFDFDQSLISEQNREMMKRVIAASARPNSTATIKGTTDRLGELSHNMELSQSRARAVQQYLASVAPQVRLDQVTGVGPSDLPYDNNLPEGRYYCRTVSLTITTPLR
ncbi:MAG: OmpA family protein ['Candidatus Kapabacteria' thiocyanatum]|uniref:OmpA-like domain-containing protein n=1 Tax=Candidatus Kapaibacterium thiocyanatum TaxID=1895771 RepID=A0A1M3KYE3_9BACT|nr:OmpA family protein ['Candidatus Kapabacteria' thiocyanatum]OJX57259.1 MAG: hypothetical protein BGO89_12280 ['Candidatus Kapabacteria' thiocyanatum]